MNSPENDPVKLLMAVVSIFLIAGLSLLAINITADIFAKHQVCVNYASAEKGSASLAVRRYQECIKEVRS